MDDKYTIERAINELLNLAYSILHYYNTPVGLQLNIESNVDDKKIHVMLEVANDDD